MYDDQDWIKATTWDVRNHDNTLVTTLDQLCFGHPSVQRIEAWQNRTAWNAAPAELKAEADEWLEANRYA